MFNIYFDLLACVGKHSLNLQETLTNSQEFNS